MKKQVQDSNKYQESAEKKIENKDNPGAAGDAEKAAEELAKAQKKLEDLLRQDREEELERLLGKLQGRIELMIRLQREINNGTLSLKTEEEQQKLDKRLVSQKSNDLAGKESKLITDEARVTLELINTDGSSVAFATVLSQVISDMESVERRLKDSDLGPVTIEKEEVIIRMLEDMLEAVRKKQDDQKKKPPMPPMPPGQPPPPMPPVDPKLLDDIAELKLIRSMQVRLNSLTENYGKEYKGLEQAPTPIEAKNDLERKKLEAVQSEYKDLAKRQEELAKIVRDKALGKNKAN